MINKSVAKGLIICYIKVRLECKFISNYEVIIEHKLIVLISSDGKIYLNHCKMMSENCDKTGIKRMPLRFCVGDDEEKLWISDNCLVNSLIHLIKKHYLMQTLFWGKLSIVKWKCNGFKSQEVLKTTGSERNITKQKNSKRNNAKTKFWVNLLVKLGL